MPAKKKKGKKAPAKKAEPTPTEQSEQNFEAAEATLSVNVAAQVIDDTNSMAGKSMAG